MFGRLFGIQDVNDSTMQQTKWYKWSLLLIGLTAMVFTAADASAASHPGKKRNRKGNTCYTSYHSSWNHSNCNHLPPGQAVKRYGGNASDYAKHNKWNKKCHSNNSTYGYQQPQPGWGKRSRNPAL